MGGCASKDKKDEVVTDAATAADTGDATTDGCVSCSLFSLYYSLFFVLICSLYTYINVYYCAKIILT